MPVYPNLIVSECILVDADKPIPVALEAFDAVQLPLAGRTFYIEVDSAAYRWVVGQSPQRIAESDNRAADYYCEVEVPDDYDGSYAVLLIGFEPPYQYTGDDTYSLAIEATDLIGVIHEQQCIPPLFHVVTENHGDHQIDLQRDNPILPLDECV